MNIYQKLQQARVDLQDMKLKKTGRNKFANYDYYELSDFLPAINAICNKLGLFTNFNIFTNKGVEIAVVKIINIDKPEESLSFTSKTKEVEIAKKADGSGGAEPIQNLGGKTTYMRRYLYITAFEIAESDLVEKINKELEDQELDAEDKAKIASASTSEKLIKICSALKKKYKISLITPLYDEQKIKLEQEESKA